MPSLRLGCLWPGWACLWLSSVPGLQRRAPHHRAWGGEGLPGGRRSGWAALWSPFSAPPVTRLPVADPGYTALPPWRVSLQKGFLCQTANSETHRSWAQACCPTHREAAAGETKVGHLVRGRAAPRMSRSHWAPSRVLAPTRHHPWLRTCSRLSEEDAP